MSKVRPSLNEIAATSQTLVALAVEAAEISKLLQESGGELSPELEARLEVNREKLPSKVDSYNYIIERLEADAALWKRRKEACAAQEKKYQGQVDRLWDRIKLAMKELGTKELQGTYYRFQLKKSAPKLIIDSEAAIPAECKMIVQTTVIDKEKIKAMLVDGFEVPGARLEENGSLVAYESTKE